MKGKKERERQKNKNEVERMKTLQRKRKLIYLSREEEEEAPFVLSKKIFLWKFLSAKFRSLRMSSTILKQF